VNCSHGLRLYTIQAAGSRGGTVVVAMTNKLALIGAGRLAQSATVTATSQQAGAEAPYLTDLRRFYPWKSVAGDLSAVDVVFDLGAARNLDTVILGGTNFDLGAECQLDAGNDPTFAATLWSIARGPAFDTSLGTLRPWVQPWGRDVVFLRAAGTVSARYVRVRSWNTTNPAGYLAADFAFIEAAWQPIRNYQTAHSEPDAFQGDIPQVLRTFRCTLHRLTEGEESQALTLVRDFKTIGRAYVIPRPFKPAHFLGKAFMGVFTKALDFQAVDQLGGFKSTSLEFQEVDV